MLELRPSIFYHLSRVDALRHAATMITEYSGLNICALRRPKTMT